MNNFIDILQERQEQLLTALLQHIQLSFIALFFALLIAIPAGIYLTRYTRIAEGAIGVTAIMQTIPSLALLGLLIPLFGIGMVPAIIALVIYALLPIIRNTYTGIKELDPSLIEAARAMGMNNGRRLGMVEIPIAMPMIMAGIRTAMVLIIGTATLAALIGAGGLGDLILLGIDRNDSNLILLGAIPAALLAIFFDVILRFLERISIRRSLTVIGISALVMIAVMVYPLISGKQGKDLVIAGKVSTEQEILLNMYKMLIEQDTDLEVEMKPGGLGQTSFVFNALKSGSIDIYPEYTGTVLSEFLKEKTKSNDRMTVYNQAKQGMLKKYEMVLLKPMKFNNTYALAVPKQFGEQNNLKNISDLKPITDQIKAGFTLEFTDREDGYLGIQKLYGITFPNLKTMEPKLRYQAIKSGDINLVDAYSTDSEMKEFNLKVLEDDKNLFPPYQCAPMLRKETAEKHPEVVKALNKLSGKISDEEMVDMNYKVNVERVSSEEVAKDYLKKVKLLK